MSYSQGTLSTSERGEEFVVEWRIPYFSTLDEMGCTSPDISFAGETWWLVIFPNVENTRGTSGHVGLHLAKMSSSRSIRVSLSLSLKTAKGERHRKGHYTRDFDGNNGIHPFHRFIPRVELTRLRSDLLPDDVLTVVCTMKRATSAGSERDDPEDAFVEPSIQRKEKSTQTVKEFTESVEASTQTVEERCSEACTSGSSTNVLEQTVLRDFKELFLNKEDSDVTIKVEGSEFPAHRAILKARSPVFASTFRHNMKENATGVLEIEDCDPSTFSDFLCFIYCGDVGIISQENVFCLFTAADKYQVLDLRAKCLEFIYKNLTVENFCETLTLALKHSETEVIKLSTDFFTRNAPKIVVTVKWQTFLTENPTASNELLVKLLVPESSCSK